MTNEASRRINDIQRVMKEVSVDAFILPSSDPHQSEYPPEHWSGRSWISGFTGSAGTVIITDDHAGLWTDSRYFLQAEIQLKGSGIVLHKLIAQAQAEYIDWICSKLKPGQIVGCDFYCFSLSQIQAFDKKLSQYGIQLIDCGDLLNSVWKDRPAISKVPVYEHPVKYAGTSREAKLKTVRSTMKKAGANLFLITALDEISYLLNLRGKDVHCNPVFLAYLLVREKDALLFIPSKKIDENIKKKLDRAGIHERAYEDLNSELEKLKNDSRIMIDQSTLNARIALKLPKDSLIPMVSPVMSMKASKNNIEASHIRKVMEKDGVALVHSFMWLEKALKHSKKVTEYDFAKQIAYYRSEQELYVGESFDAIVGYAGNGAIIHYKPEKATASVIKPKGILLVDSGGQYIDGTTDITRTIALSKVDNSVKKAFTAVLMGHIALADAVFPEHTKGIQLDILARQYLWQLSLNYSHGTGHGVGYFMNVHEPPQGFVTAWNQRGQAEMVPGMLTSNEPGYYKEGAYGIRTENLVLNVIHSETKEGRYLKFETVSLYPVDIALIHEPMMTRQSIDWLNKYHKEVYKRLSPYLNKQERRWLKGKCKTV